MNPVRQFIADINLNIGRLHVTLWQVSFCHLNPALSAACPEKKNYKEEGILFIVTWPNNVQRHLSAFKMATVHY